MFAATRAVVLRVLILVLLARVEVSLRRRSIAEVCAALKVEIGDGGSTHDEAQDVTGIERPWMIVNRVRAIDQMMAFWPSADTCLRRCLVLAVLVRSERPTLEFGVRRRPDGDIAAHSWVVVSGQSIDPMSRYYLSLTG